MAIHIIFGRGGTGKSAYQMHVVVEQLRHSERNICTNLTIDLGLFNIYLEKTYPDECLRPIERIRILDQNEAREFWNFRGPARVDLMVPSTEWLADKGKQGVCYIIDEAGVVGFSAAGWAQKEGQTTRGAACLWYLDQQRKFGDDVYASTNGVRPGGIAKSFRDKAHYFIKLKNGYLTTYGVFKARPRFTWYKFTSEPTDKNAEPIANGEFKMDGAGLMGCYRTEDGVGISGVRADKGQKAKGIPIMYIFPMLLALGLVLASIPYLLGRGANHLLTRGRKPQTTKYALASSPAVHVATVEEPARETKLVTGLSFWGRHYVVMFSDGDVVREGDGRVTRIGKSFVICDGVRYGFAAGKVKTLESAVRASATETKKPAEAGS